MKCYQVPNLDTGTRAGIFSAFRPTAIEYVVDQDETKNNPEYRAHLKRLQEKGMKLVNVIRDIDTVVEDWKEESEEENPEVEAQSSNEVGSMKRLKDGRHI
jgi:hypothetical protein